MTDIESIPSPTPQVKDYRSQIIEAAREKLTRYLPRAIDILTELAEGSDNDRVRLAAAQDIADRAGLTKSSTVQVAVSAAEHEASRRDAEDVVARIRENQRARVPISIEALIVHEGDEQQSGT